MTDSILNSTKKMLSIAEDDDTFDLDITLHINSVFMTLNQLGVGPIDAFMIMDATPTWSEFLGTETNINAVKSYVYLKVRLMFDPPATSFAIESFAKQAEELEFRLMVQAESNPLNSSFMYQVTESTDFSSTSEPGDIGIDPDTGDVWMNT